MKAADEVILDLMRQWLGGVDRVHNGQMMPPPSPSTTDPVVVSYPLPYVVYFSNVGADDVRRLGGRRIVRSHFFRLMYVGDAPDQAAAMGEKARDLLERRSITVNGKPTAPITCDESQQIRRDDNVMRPDGSPLYYGIDLWSVAVRNAAIPTLVPIP